MDMSDIISGVRAAIASIEARIEARRNVIVGCPWVIECAPGLYLVADGEGRFRGGSIDGRVAMYSPEKIDEAVAYVRANSGGVFAGARKVGYNAALERELAAMRDLAERAERLAIPA